MRELPGFQDVTSDLRVTSPTMMVEIDRDRAASLGVDAKGIEVTLGAAFGARKISTILTSSNQYSVILELAPEYQYRPKACPNSTCARTRRARSRSARSPAHARAWRP